VSTVLMNSPTQNGLLCFAREAASNCATTKQPETIDDKRDEIGSNRAWSA
jgi:hypothetical protein